MTESDDDTRTPDVQLRPTRPEITNESRGSGKETSALAPSISADINVKHSGDLYPDPNDPNFPYIKQNSMSDYPESQQIQDYNCKQIDSVSYFMFSSEI